MGDSSRCQARLERHPCGRWLSTIFVEGAGLLAAMRYRPTCYFIPARRHERCHAGVAIYHLFGSVCCISIPRIFLYNFWLAPFKILKERGDAAESSIVPDDWKNVRSYTLDEAANLWAGLQPHQPKNTEATAAFFRLRGDMLSGALRHQTGIAKTMNKILGEVELPKGTQVITANNLRRYADSIGDVPAFLEAVVVPVEPIETDSTEGKETDDN